MADILCDIDGTVADLEHRRHWLKSKPKNWKAFYADVSKDAPIESTIFVIRELAKTNRIIFCTGRSSEHKTKTVQWLEKYVHLKQDLLLYMRQEGDYRDDSIIKLELLDQIRRDGFDPKFVFEDRKRVKRMWVENGIFVFDVNQQDEEF